MVTRGVVLQVVARLVLGPSVVVAAALIVKGYVDVGDGFAAGMVVALAVALSYLALGAAGAEETLPVLRYAPQVAIAGLLLSLAVGFFPLLWGEPVFSHYPGRGEHVVTIGSFELFTPLLFDVGVFLLVVGVMTMFLHHFADPVEHTGDTTEAGDAP
ncbi:MnhB domain-containing protein [Mycolicibacterium flavescens]|uniref:Sodium:proton antiporter n=1 Tax=Mycolicibacterium flavescens TaxID=1776 RepID=A0A1E3RCK4_MYCFV|nr:MnhB domain-containing protein [Mycolicibacterium flavescens]MCV7280110.1 MnhB domain-containing protein [Mycolicibacterium flavescens]ODQ87625.1 sodium:proton antiporter [Mycolicibacterium flavescens]